jgi:hypothetical protein
MKFEGMMDSRGILISDIESWLHIRAILIIQPSLRSII